MKLPKPPIKLSELAQKWGKGISDLLPLVAAGKMEAYCWYEGFVISTSAVVQSQGHHKYFSGWVKPNIDDLKPLQINTRVKMRGFTIYPPYKDDYPSRFFPAIPNTKGSLDHTYFRITADDLFFMFSEVERMEEEDEGLAHHTIEVSKKENKHNQEEELSVRTRKEKMNDDILFPAEKKSLLTIIIGIVKLKYKWNPEDKRSDVTGQIVTAVKNAQLTIHPDTVKHWLKEAATLEAELLKIKKEKEEQELEAAKNLSLSAKP